jgi:hypothetical protein
MPKEIPVFIYGLFNDTVISSEHTVNCKMTSEYQVVRNVAESGCRLIEGLSLPLPGATKEKHESLNQKSRSLDQYLNLGLSKYKA